MTGTDGAPSRARALSLARPLLVLVLLLAGQRGVVRAAPQVAANGAGPCSLDSAAGDAVPEWRPSADARHGVKEFDRTTRVVFPASTPSIVVEAWGGGGGGGGGSADTFSEGGAGGGGGAGGSYARAAMTLPEGRSYMLVVGHGGRGGNGAGRGADRAQAGEAGGDSAVCAAGSLTLIAPGGSGGHAAASNAHGGPAGRNDVSEELDPEPQALVRPGMSGADGARPLFIYRGWGGRGGRAVVGSVQPRGAFGGGGGAGAKTPEPPGNGASGAPGSIVVSW